MNTLGIIFSYTERENLRELTKRRTLSSLPFAGKYRMIDVILSNYVTLVLLMFPSSPRIIIIP